MYGELLKAVTGPGCEISYNHTPSFTARAAFFYVQSVGHYFCNRDYITQRRGYKSFLLIYTVKGKGYANYRDKHYEVCKGQVLLMDCYDYQEYFTDKNDLWEIKWIHFNGSGCESYYNIIYENYGPLIDLKGDNSVEAYIDELIELLKKNDNQFEIKASGAIAQMLTDIMLAANNGARSCSRENRNYLIGNAQRLVEENYCSDISLEDMAKSACCSVYHFIRLFKKATGYSPHEYLIKYRINKAKSLLKTSDKGIDEIAADVGFKSTSNFIRTFREIEDMTPLKFRKFWVS